MAAEARICEEVADSIDYRSVKASYFLDISSRPSNPAKKILKILTRFLSFLRFSTVERFLFLAGSPAGQTAAQKGQQRKDAVAILLRSGKKGTTMNFGSHSISRTVKLLNKGFAATTGIAIFGILAMLVGCTDSKPKPEITSFVAAKSSITAGASTTLTAVFANGTGSVDQNVGVVTSGTAVTVSPAATTTYTLTVTGTDGSTTTAQTTVTVVAAPAITSFAAAKSTITAGASTTLTAVFANGTGSVDQSVGAVTSGTAVTVSPSASTTYTLTVTNTAGTSTTAQATVTVVAAPTITSFGVNPAAVASGATSMLTAVFSNGSGTIDHNVGSVTSGVGVSTAAITASTTFTLTVTNTAGTSATATATVTLSAAGGKGTFLSTGALTTARLYHSATLLPNGLVLIAGGTSGPGATMDSAELYDPSTGKYTAIAGQMVSTRYSHTATLLPNGKVLLAGGLDINNYGLASAELYDPATQSFTATTGSMTTAMYWQTATLLSNGKVLLAGGTGSDSNASANAELYDPATDSFTSTGPMTAAREYHSATLLPNGKVLIAGGYDFIAVSSAELYDPASGKFTATGSMNTASMEHTATLLWDGTVLIAGGDSDSGAVTSRAEIYDPATALFTATTNAMNVARRKQGAVLLPNGNVLLVGGDGDNSGTDQLASGELYDPLLQTFTLVQTSMSVGKDDFTMTLLPNDTVLIVGGEGLTGGSSAAVRSGSVKTAGSNATPMGTPTVGALSGSELYDPQDPAPTGFSATGNMNYARIYFTATQLGNGKFLIAGGEDANLNDVIPAELYDPATGFFMQTGSITARFRIGSMSVWLPNGKVLIAAGEYGMSSAELYNPATGTFTATGSLVETRGRGNAAATLLPNGKVLLTGGDTQSGNVGTAELYNPATGSFSATGRMGACRTNQTLTLLPSSGLVLVAGGASGCAGNEVETIDTSVGELYHQATGTFSATGKMSIHRYYHTATMLPNGKVLIAGGQTDGYVPVATAELYDPSTGTFTATGSMTVAREFHTATALPNGKVMIIGGNGPIGQVQGDEGPITQYGTLASAELYDPASGTFTAAGSMEYARAYHKAVMLWNGKVMVAGGYPAHTSNNGGAIATAEVSH